MTEHQHEAETKPGHEAKRLGPDLKEWNQKIEKLMHDGARIITFRGAGTVNGIDRQAAETATAMLHDYVEHITADGTPVVLMYDGDGDNREKPDVGAIFGGLNDILSDNPNVTAIAAQTEGWYSPKTPNGPIESATGKPYETYVFPDNLPGAHASLTQSEKLTSYPGYEQIFVGPAGPIAFEQLGDLSQKAANRSEGAGEVRVTVLATPNNPTLDAELNTQLEAATDEQTKAKIAAKLEQRAKQPYGALFTPEGEFSVDPNQFPGVKFTVESVR